jgi:hypothetical protein
LKPLQEVIGKTLEDTGIGNYFLSSTLVAHEIRIDKRERIKFKSFRTSKETITRIKKQPSE